MLEVSAPNDVAPAPPNAAMDAAPPPEGVDPASAGAADVAPSLPHPRRRRRIPIVLALFTAAILGAGGVGIAVSLLGVPSLSAGSTAAGAGHGMFTPSVVAVCNSPQYISASSLLITQPNPVGTLAKGGSLNVVFQFSVNASSVSTVGMSATFPSLFATFPLTSGSQQVYIAPATVPIPASGWSTSTSFNKTIVPTTALAFKVGASATLSSQKLSVMTPTNYTKLTLQYRWSWSFTQPNGTKGQSGWSVPTPTDHLPAQLRSIFYPAPYVSFLGSSGSTATIGTNYTATLGGAVAGKYFLLEMEFPGTGKVVQAQAQTAPAGATSFVVFIPMLSYTHSLAPGTYLVHIHDACGALLYNKSVLAVFAPTATVHFTIAPTTCSAKFNGTSWFSGSAATVVPSIVAYSMSVGC